VFLKKTLLVGVAGLYGVTHAGGGTIMSLLAGRSHLGHICRAEKVFNKLVKPDQILC
jgi:hypothetical protein